MRTKRIKTVTITTTGDNFRSSRAIEWIAHNEVGPDTDVAMLAARPTVIMLAEITHRSAHAIAGAVLGAQTRDRQASQSKMREGQVWAFVTAYVAERGDAPTLMEILLALEISSVGTVHNIITRLQRRGVIERRAPGGHRSLRLVIPYAPPGVRVGSPGHSTQTHTATGTN